jgi:phage gp29-like protein
MRQVRRDIVQSDADSLAATLQRQLVRPLVGFNFGWDCRLPQVQFLPRRR